MARRHCCGGSSPTRPSTASRNRSAWPTWRAYSSCRSTSNPAQVRRPVPERGEPRRLVETAVGERGGHRCLRALDRGLPELVQLRRRVVGRRTPLVAGIGAAVDRRPTADRAPTGDRADRHPLLDAGHVLDQAADRHGRSAGAAGQGVRVQAADLPGELRPGPVEREEQHLDLVGRQRRLVDRACPVVISVRRVCPEVRFSDHGATLGSQFRTYDFTDCEEKGHGEHRRSARRLAPCRRSS